MTSLTTSLTSHVGLLLQSSSYWVVTSLILSLITYNAIPNARKMRPKTVKVIIVDWKEGMGLQAGRVYCLNLEFLSFSTFSLIFCFSSSEISILLVNKIYYLIYC